MFLMNSTPPTLRCFISSGQDNYFQSLHYKQVSGLLSHSVYASCLGTLHPHDACSLCHPLSLVQWSANMPLEI